jgi:hypothetical protein
MRRASSIAAAAVLVALAAPLRAQGIAEPQAQTSAMESQPSWQYPDQPPQFGDQRFIFRRSDDGYRRIDVSTGEVATCRKGDAGWFCVAAPDERAAVDVEIARLRHENALLKNALKEAGLPLPDDAAATLAAPPSPAGDEPPRPPETVPPSTTASIPEPSVGSHPVPPEAVPGAPREPKSSNQASRNDREINRIMQVMERAWRRLVDMMAAIQRDMRKS